MTYVREVVFKLYLNDRLKF